MGFRFNRSFKLGNCFRINFSKKGVGYSFGGKGFRVAKKASGGSRATASIPGTGISYVKDYSRKKSKSSRKRSSNQTYSANQSSYTYTQPDLDLKDIKDTNELDSNIAESASLHDITQAIRNYYKTNIWVHVISFIICGLLSGSEALCILGCIGWVIAWYFIQKKNKVNLDYNFEDSDVTESFAKMFSMRDSQKVWIQEYSARVTNSKYAGGANDAVQRRIISISRRLPVCIKTNSEAFAIKDKKVKYVFLPDMILIIKGTKSTAINYSDLEFTYDKVGYLEEQVVPKDSEILEYRYRYVTKSGQPDKRYSNNPCYPLCLYKTLRLNGKGIDLTFMYSKSN